MTSAAVIEFNHTTLAFTPQAGVFDLNYAVPAGEIFGLIGPSGCGKTTSVRLVLGLHTPQSGEVRVLGAPVSQQADAQRQRTGYMPQQFVLYPELTVNENLNFVAALYGLSPSERRARIGELLEIVDMGPARRRLAKHLSGGQRRRLALMAALLHDPRLLLADEPTAGIDPLLRERLWDYLRAYRDRGNSLLITTQYVGEAVFCDRVGIMDHGRIFRHDTPAHLRQEAFGGEIIEVELTPGDGVLKAQQALQDHPAVKRTAGVSSHPGKIHLFTEHAAGCIPEIIAHLNQVEGVELRSIDAYEPPFAEVFRVLVDRRRQEMAEA